MSLIMTLAVVNDETLYNAAGFYQGNDGFWHVDNSFVVFMKRLYKQYQAVQLQEKYA